MDTNNWGNNAPERQLPPPQYTPINYLKLFWTIVAAIITAFFIMSLFSWVIFVNLANAFMSDISTKASTKPLQQQLITPQQQPLQLTRELNALALRNQQAAEQASKAAREKAAAKRQNMQTCHFWRDQYQKDKLERSKSYRDSACARAYAN